jgi:glucose-1-phosphate adenylyltransferase
MGPEAVARHSLVSHGCIVNGSVTNSVLSPGVKIYEGAVVRDSIILLDTEIGPGSRVDTAIIDKFVVVGPGAVVGFGDDLTTPNADEPDRLFSGITVVGERALIPEGARLGRNCLVEPRAVPADFAAFPDLLVPSGGSVRRCEPPPP